MHIFMGVLAPHDRGESLTEFDQVEVHLTILQNIELVNIFRIFVDFLFDKPSYERRSTSVDAKALKALYCENLVVVLGVQERTQKLERLVAVDNVCCPFFEFVKGHLFKENLSFATANSKPASSLRTCLISEKIFRTTLQGPLRVKS